MQGKAPYKKRTLTTWLPEIKQLPFRAAMAAKVNILLAEYGSVAKTAERVGIQESTLRRLMDGSPVVLPSTADKIDEHYFLCWERRELRHKGRKESKARSAIAKRQIAAAWQQEAGRQAIENNVNFLEPATGASPDFLTMIVPGTEDDHLFGYTADKILFTAANEQARDWLRSHCARHADIKYAAKGGLEVHKVYATMLLSKITASGFTTTVDEKFSAVCNTLAPQNFTSKNS